MVNSLKNYQRYEGYPKKDEHGKYFQSINHEPGRKRSADYDMRN